MIKLKKLIIIILILTSLFLTPAGVNAAESDLWLPYTGRFNGHWDLSVGAHIWPPDDYYVLKNLQLRTAFDLAPGLRFHSILRSNKEFDRIDVFDPTFDELYLEAYGHHESDLGKLSLSLKAGKMRYLRFPYPDLISTFDHVPGIEDLRLDDQETGYSGQMLTLEYESKYNLGYHLTGINWDYGDREGRNLIENYLFYRNDFGPIDFEARAGRMQLRRPVSELGRGGRGYSIYLGGSWEGYKAGFLYENLRNEELDQQDIMTGVMVTFDFSSITELFGEVRFDYTRSPQGIGMHFPLAGGYIGDLKEEPPENGVLVGEIEAERVITYWQNSQGRNFYEHRISSWGEQAGDDIVVVIDEEPWYLKLEALVSPNTSFRTWDDLVTWERQRQGPAQLGQYVTYEFYRVE